MCEEEPYNVAFYRGDILILELVGGDVFKGEYVDGGTHHIDLIKVKQKNNPNNLGGVHTFYRKEIENIRISRSEEIKKLIVELQNKKNEDEDVIKMEPEEYYRHRQMAKEYMYIDKIDKRYSYAIESLSEVETIGIFPLGMESSRIQILAVSSWDEVYLFDFARCKRKNFYPELRKMLESRHVCKVIHNAGPFARLLKENYKILAKNIFDTQAVDLVLQKTEKGDWPEKLSSLSQCLKRYFNLPKGLIRDALKSVEEDWSERPLEDDKKLYASQLATYLVALRDKMDSILMTETDKVIDDYQNYYHNLTKYDLCVLICKKKKLIKDLKKIINSSSPSNS